MTQVFQPRNEIDFGPPPPNPRGGDVVAAGMQRLRAGCKPARLFVLCLAAVLFFSGCQALKVNPPQDRIQASNLRQWSPEFSSSPALEMGPSESLAPGEVRLRNIRDNEYLTERDFVVSFFDRTFDLNQIRSVDFIVVPFNNLPLIAHTMLSFGLDDDTHVVVSAEIRTEKGEEYSPILGFFRQYELTYLVATERDVIRLRTHHRDAEVYIYPTVATPEQAQQLFVSVMGRANQLNQRPEFYNTVHNNCTTNLVSHVNQIQPDSVPFAWQVLLPGHSDRYAYDLGLLDRSIPFEQLKSRCLINDLANKYYSEPDFSRRIRERIARLE